MFQTDLQEYLKSRCGCDCFMNKAPQETTTRTTPKLVWNVPNDEPIMALDGVTNLSKKTLSVRIYSELLNDAKVIASNVSTVLNGYRGTMGNTYVPCCRLTNSSEELEEPIEGEVGNLQIEMDFDIWVGG